jgi:hypothetical protein
MNESQRGKIQSATRKLVGLLVEKNYEEAEKLSNGDRLSAQALRDAVQRYGRTVATPPDDAFARIDAIHVVGSAPAKFSVRFDLWTEEEGRSDLTLEFSVTDMAGEPTVVSIDDLHTL